MGWRNPQLWPQVLSSDCSSRPWLSYRAFFLLLPDAFLGGPPKSGMWAMREVHALHSCQIIYSEAHKFQDYKFQFRDSQENDYKRTCWCSRLEQTCSFLMHLNTLFTWLIPTVLGDKNQLCSAFTGSCIQSTNVTKCLPWATSVSQCTAFDGAFPNLLSLSLWFGPSTFHINFTNYIFICCFHYPFYPEMSELSLMNV